MDDIYTITLAEEGCSMRIAEVRASLKYVLDILIRASLIFEWL